LVRIIHFLHLLNHTTKHILNNNIPFSLPLSSFLGPGFYKQIVTMSYLGIEDSPLGIRITIYDPLRCEEKGIFVTIEEKFYKKTQAELDTENTLSNGQKKR